MYLFSITINIEDSFRDEWLAWVTPKLRVLLEDKALVQDFRLLKILSEEPNNGSTYSFQYALATVEALAVFGEHYDQSIALGMYRLYKDKFVEFRTQLEIVDWKFL